MEKCTNCSNANSLRINTSSNNFSLQANSPARNAGIASDVYQTFFNLHGIDIAKDLAGTFSPQGSAWDIGAYEYDEGNTVAQNSPTNHSVL